MAHDNRTHAVLSASSSKRWLNCPPSAKLNAEIPDITTEYAKEGTDAHELAELTRLGFSDEVKALLKKHGAERLSAVDDAEFPALMKEAEALGSKA